MNATALSLILLTATPFAEPTQTRSRHMPSDMVKPLKGSAPVNNAKQITSLKILAVPDIIEGDVASVNLFHASPIVIQFKSGKCVALTLNLRPGEDVKIDRSEGACPSFRKPAQPAWVPAGWRFVGRAWSYNAYMRDGGKLVLYQGDSIDQPAYAVDLPMNIFSVGGIQGPDTSGTIVTAVGYSRSKLTIAMFELP